MDHFSDAPKMELTVWGPTIAIFVSSAFSARSQVKSARSKAGDIKPGSTGPRIWTNLAFLGQSGGLCLLPLVYWSATASDKFRQLEWMTEYTLPSPTDIFGVGGVTVGRTVGLLGVFAGAILTRTALKALGDQCSAIGVSLLSSRGYRTPTAFLGYTSGRNPDWLTTGLSHTSATQFTRKFPRHLLPNRPFTILIHSASLIIEASLALTFRSYLTLYALPLAIGGYLLKVLIEVHHRHQHPRESELMDERMVQKKVIVEDPELGNEYKFYKVKAPYRIAPYAWRTPARKG